MNTTVLFMYEILSSLFTLPPLRSAFRTFTQVRGIGPEVCIYSITGLLNVALGRIQYRHL